jgi:hypothetical protein
MEKEKSQTQEDNAVRHLTNEIKKFTKKVNDLKSDVGMIKQHVFQKPTLVGSQNFCRHNGQVPFQGRGDNDPSGGNQQQSQEHAAASYKMAQANQDC